MAEYYPLISRAVAGLRAGKPEARKAIYDRARQALVAQLRAMDPPVPEDAIARETAALDDAIARSEAEIVGDAAKTSAPEPQPAPTPSPFSAKPAAPAPAQASRAAWRNPTEAPSLGGAKRDADLGTSAAPAVPPRATRPAQPRSAVRAASPGAMPPPASPVDTPSVSEPAKEQVQDAASMPAAATLRVEPVERETAPDWNAEPDTDVADQPNTPGEIRSGRNGAKDEPVRPAAPRPAPERRSRLGMWIVAAAALVAVVAIAVTAWRLRDKPEDLARTAAPVQATQTAPDKIAERADDSGGSGFSAATATAPVASDEASRTAKEATPAPATSTTSTGDQPAATGTTSVAAPAVPTPATTPEASLPIAYKAAILVDAPDTPEKVKTYVGTVVWHAESVPTGQGQPLGMAIQADVSIPDANVQLMMQIRRNTESQLPASHTIDLKFTIGNGSPIGSIKQVSVPQMRKQDMPTGDPLAGIPVTISDNYFLVGLVRGNAEEQNLDLLRSRQWIDIPMLLANGKASKITFEKGANGERIFNDVLDSWKAAGN